MFPILTSISYRDLLARRHSQISWFTWIAGLSAINTFIAIIGTPIMMIFGLGVTTYITDSFGVDFLHDSAHPAAVVAFGISFALAGLFWLLGYVARRMYAWPLWVGLALYIVDLFPLYLARDYISFAFHLYVIYRLIEVIRTDRELRSRPVPEDLLAEAASEE